MNPDIAFVFSVLAVAAVMMASNKVRFDTVALLVVLALMLSGVLTPGEALAGFGNPVVILVAGLLIVGEMLSRTGVARAVGDLILKRGGTQEGRLLVVIMVSAALLGSVMSSTAVVAIFIPIVLRVAAESGLAASRMLIPVSYASLISGMLTLVATPPNLVVHEELKAAGFSGFSFFGFAPVGIAVLAVAVVYILVLGRRLLPGEVPEDRGRAKRRSVLELWEEFRVELTFERMRITKDSPLSGRTIADNELETRFDVRVVGLQRRRSRGEHRVAAPSANAELREEDILVVAGMPEDIARLIEECGMIRLPASDQERQRWLWELGGATLLIHPESRLVGKSIVEADFRASFGMQVLGLRRDQEAIADFPDERLQRFDTLFVLGPWSRIRKLQARIHDFVVLEMPSELADVVPAYTRMPVSLAILAAMVGLVLLDLVPLVAAVLMACIAAVATRCLTMEDGYRAIHWSSIVLVAGMLPLADALQRTGATDLVVGGLLSAAGDGGPLGMLTLLFFLTAAIGLFLSNTASAVLVAPIAISAAAELGVSPYPFCVAVVIAASAAFVTPVSTPVVTLVVEPGRYKFMDFVKVGVPLLVLAWGVTLLTAPLVFPFQPG